MNTVSEAIPGEAAGGSESTTTVLLALGANALIAVAKSVAAFLTGSASMLAEAAHSWADTGNEVLLLIAGRRSKRPADARHPLGYGKDAYVWSMFAALGLFAIGAGVSITHGIQELIDPEDASDYLVAYVVLAISFVLEGISFRQALKQTRAEARQVNKDVLEHALETSDPTVRAVFAEDAAALIGLVIAGSCIVIHQIAGLARADAVGSILVGLLLAVVALILINRNRRFLIGEEVDGTIRTAALTTLLDQPEIDRVTYLRLEFLGPRQVMLIASIDIVGNATESDTADTLHALRSRIEARSPKVRRAFLSLATADEPSLTP